VLKICLRRSGTKEKHGKNAKDKPCLKRRLLDQGWFMFWFTGYNCCPAKLPNLKAKVTRICCFWSPWIQEFLQRTSSEQVESNELEYLLHGHACIAHELLVGQQQVHGQGCVNLDEDGIFRVADKALDAQGLLDFTEEYFDAPALLVDVGDGSGGQTKEIGHKFVTLARFRGSIADAAQS